MNGGAPYVKARLKRYVLSFLLKISTVVQSLISTGRLFQRKGPQWLKADSPYFFVEVLGMTRSLAVEDLMGLLGSCLSSVSER